MSIDISSIKSLLGDRLLVRPLARPAKMGGILIPSTLRKEKDKEQVIWWGVVEALGRDSKYPDAYEIGVGDIVGVEIFGRECETIKTDDGEDHCWVAEEFIAARDNGRVKAYQDDKKWDKTGVGIIPVGEYILVEADAEDERKNGIYIPISAREQQKQGTCLLISKGKIIGDQLEPLHIESDSRLLFGRYSGSAVKLDKEFLLMKQCDVVAVLEAVKETANA